jgi:hypothetical protein
MELGSKIIAVDFDGTLCENKWPEIGEPNEDLINYLRSRQYFKDKIILWTCRTGFDLRLAVAWCEEHGLYFDAVNENLPEAIAKYGGDSRKIYADEYIDDRNSHMFYLPYKPEDWIFKNKFQIKEFKPDPIDKAIQETLYREALLAMKCPVVSSNERVIFKTPDERKED